MVTTSSFHCREPRVRSLVTELRSSMPHDMAKKKRLIERKIYIYVYMRNFPGCLGDLCGKGGRRGPMWMMPGCRGTLDVQKKVAEKVGTI